MGKNPIQKETIMEFLAKIKLLHLTEPEILQRMEVVDMEVTSSYIDYSCYPNKNPYKLT